MSRQFDNLFEKSCKSENPGGDSASENVESTRIPKVSNLLKPDSDLKI
jgi:hypothetical protein